VESSRAPARPAALRNSCFRLRSGPTGRPRLRHRPTEVKPDPLRVGGINLYRDNAAGLHNRTPRIDTESDVRSVVVERRVDCHVLRWASRYFHPQPKTAFPRLVPE
jgi:hypothetical protein